MLFSIKSGDIDDAGILNLCSTDQHFIKCGSGTPGIPKTYSERKEVLFSEEG